MTGTMFGHYRLDSLLGRGGMGEVWRALDTRKDRVVALKVLGPWLAGDADFARRFAREASLAARLRGPHVVPIHDYGAVEGRLFIDMELVDGVDLGALIEREGRLAVGRTVDLVGQTAKALDTAHRAGMVHRDVKPSNVLISDNGGDEFVHLIDFGIARAADGTAVSLSGMVVGTPAYMAPERFDGRGDHRSDVYALGCVLYEMLTGRKPFAADGIVAWGTAHHHTPPPRPTAADPALPRGLDDVVARAMAKDPDARFRSAGELADAARTAIVVAPAAARRAPIEAAPTYIPAFAPPGVPPGVPGSVDHRPRATPPLPRPPAAPPAARRPAVRRWALPVAAVAATAAVVAGVVLVEGRGPTTGVVAGGPTATLPTPAATATTGATRSPAPTVAASAIRVGDNPWTVALAPDGRRAYTADDGSGTVSVVDTASRAVTATVTVGGRPADVAVSPDGTRAYVPDLGVYPAKGDTVRVIDTAAGTVVDTITVGSLPADVAVTPDGRQLYVANSDTNSVSVIDTATHRVVGSVATSSGPDAVAFSPDGRRAYVACDYAGRVTVIDTTARSVVATVRVESSPQELAVSPDGRQVYVANKQQGGGVSVIDTGSNTVTGRIATGEGPNAVAFRPDGRRAYVSNFFDGTVSVIDTATAAVVATRTGFDSPDSVAVSPDGRTLYVAENGAGRIAVRPADGD